MSDLASAGIDASGAPVAVVSTRPVTLPSTYDRSSELRVRVSAPVSGHDLPVIVFAHGFGSSMDGYAPLVDYWATRGFAVIQPTFLDSRTVGFTLDDPRAAELWRLRVRDLTCILDELRRIETTVPGLDGRLDQSRIAVAGHSWGAQSVSTLLGARVNNSDGQPGEDLRDPRVTAGVLISIAGRGGDSITRYAAETFPHMNANFEAMNAPALIIAGDRDDLPFTTRGPDWLLDAYRLSPAPKSLLTVFGGEHSLGGIAGYEVAETTDENPDRVALVQQLSWAYLCDALHIDGTPWKNARETLEADDTTLGQLESK